MTLRLRRKHQITPPIRRQPIQRDKTQRSSKLLRRAAFALAIAGSMFLSDTSSGQLSGQASAQEYVRGSYQPKRFNAPASAVHNIPQKRTGNRSLLDSRFTKQSSQSQVATTGVSSGSSAHIDVPSNPLRRGAVASASENRTEQKTEYRTANRSEQRTENRRGTIATESTDISSSVEDILGAGRSNRQVESRVRQASAVQVTDLEFEGEEIEFDTGEPEVEVINIDQEASWQKRRHVTQNATPYPLQLNAARETGSQQIETRQVQKAVSQRARRQSSQQVRQVEPKDDPFGDSASSVLRGEQTRSVSYPRRRFQQDDEADEEIDLGSPTRDDGEDDDDTGRDILPEKRDEDRRFETNCDDVAAEVATRNVSLINLNLRPLIQGDDTLPLECPMAQVGNPIRCWENQTFTFTASALCHKPLYFEDIQLERYGHSAGPLLQPFKSAAHFFTRYALLPYQMGIHPPNECVYALGYYRPGDCAPWLMDPFPLSRRGLLYEAGFATGAAFLIP